MSRDTSNAKRPNYWLCSWPGLRDLWTQGRWGGLWSALGFAALLNLALLSTLVWPELLGPTIPRGLWLAAAAIWFAGFWWQLRSESRVDPAVEASQEVDALFIQAQTEYLIGNWDQAVWLLRKRLAAGPRDIEARLLLATVYRRQRHPELALEQLQLLKRLDQSADWSLEIEREIRSCQAGLEVADEASKPEISAESSEHSTPAEDLRKMKANTLREAA